MLRRSAVATVLLLAALVLVPRSAAAQGPGDTNIFGGYSFMHDNNDTFAPNFPGGFEVGLNHRLNGAMPKLTLGAKFQSSFQTLDTPFGPGTEDFSKTAFLFGVTFGPPPDVANKIWVFGSAYIGATRYKDDFLGSIDTASYFTFQPGAGVGFFLTPNLGLQFTGEVPIIRETGATVTAFRLSGSVSVRLR